MEETPNSRSEPKKLPKWKDLHREDQEFIVVSGVALLGILALISTSRSARKTNKILEQFRSEFEMVIRNRDEHHEAMRVAISQLRAAGKEFSFYPGVGVYMDKVYQY